MLNGIARYIEKFPCDDFLIIIVSNTWIRYHKYEYITPNWNIFPSTSMSHNNF